jgi:predicted P-loop ATPase
VKADNILIASGLQGLNKSSIVSAISPFPEAFGELDLAAKDADISRQLIGKLILELSELKGMRAKEMSHLKQFVSRREEEWIPKYKEKNARYKRRCMFIGTTNETDFLVDETGNRRWLPFKAGVCKPELLEQTRDQLWAEARELFNAHGVMWQGLSELATEHHPSYMEDDVWFDAVRDYLFEVDDCLGRSPSQDAISISDILARCLHVDLPYQDQRMKNRISKILRRLGFEQRTEGPKEHRRRVYRLVE